MYLNEQFSAKNLASSREIGYGPGVAGVSSGKRSGMAASKAEASASRRGTGIAGMQSGKHLGKGERVRVKLTSPREWPTCLKASVLVCPSRLPANPNPQNGIHLHCNS